MNSSRYHQETSILSPLIHQHFPPFAMTFPSPYCLRSGNQYSRETTGCMDRVQDVSTRFLTQASPLASRDLHHGSSARFADAVETSSSISYLRIPGSGLSGDHLIHEDTSVPMAFDHAMVRPYGPPHPDGVDDDATGPKPRSSPEVARPFHDFCRHEAYFEEQLTGRPAKRKLAHAAAIYV